MDRNTPTSPGLPLRTTEPLKSEPIPSGFHELIQHNNSNSNTGLHPQQQQQYHHRGSAGVESVQVRSQPGSRYGTPVPQHGGHDSSHYNNRAGSGQLLQQGYHQSMYSHDSSPYGPIPEAHHPYSTPATSPPTPSQASDSRITRSGNGAHKTDYSKALAPKRAAVEKSTPKGKKAGKKPVNKNSAALRDVAGINGALSELTKDSEIELIDIPAFITRPIEERFREVEEGKTPGHIKRPMNAFMLYRKAYQGRAKEFMKQLNHQIVSTVCGTSWKHESQEFQDQFKEWADIERANHKKAFPDYKFAPAKTKPKPKAAGRADSEELVLDPHWADRQGSRALNTPSHHGGLDSEYSPPPRSLYGMPQYGYGGGISPHTRSAFEFNNPGKHLPQAYDHRDMGGASYYETQVHHRQPRMHHPGGVVEDIMLHKTPSPGLPFSSANQGRANMHSHYSMAQYSTHSPGMEAQQLPPPPQPQRFEHRIDPSLMGHEGGMYDGDNLFFDGNNMAGAQQAWTPSLHLAANQGNEGHFAESYLSGAGGGGGLDETLSVEQQTQYLRGAHEWEIEPLADGSAFDASWAEK
ncbi:hypothetical protein QBC39DRAFT_156518 [Podospora conica]|nr:hypothetical protein QBC39DRAFT_156518 [Schizothecium conicum]